MGFEAALNGAGVPQKDYGYYSYHEYDDTLQEWADEMESKFPGGLEYEYIEVSPKMSKYQAKAYFPQGEPNYIRVAEDTVDNYSDEYIKMILLHELVHIWMSNNGHGHISDGDKVFNWVLGMVGADVSGEGPGTRGYKIMMEFLEHEE